MLPILRPCSRGSLSNFGHSPGGHCYRRLAGREAAAKAAAPAGSKPAGGERPVLEPLSEEPEQDPFEDIFKIFNRDR